MARIKHARNRGGSLSQTTKITMLILVAMSIFIFANLSHLSHVMNTSQIEEIARLRIELERARSLSPLSRFGPNDKVPPYLSKTASINSYWWPSPDRGGMHPKDCSKAILKIKIPAMINKRLKIFIIVLTCRSLDKKLGVDNRGLGAMGTVAMWHMMHGAFN